MAFFDEDLLEEGLIPFPAVGRHGVLVGARAVREALQAELDQVLGGDEARAGESDLGFGSVRFAVDPFLFSLQRLDGDGIGLVGAKQLVALRGKLNEAPACALALLASVPFSTCHLELEVTLDVALNLGRELNLLVDGFDLTLDRFDAPVELSAFGPATRCSTYKSGWTAGS